MFKQILVIAALLTLAAVATAITAILKRRSGGGPNVAEADEAGAAPGPLPYEKRRYLFSKAEKSFYLVLLDAIPDNHVVFAKVRVADALVLKKGTRHRQRAFNRISAKHIDYLICDREWLEPRLAIELDDASHDEEDRQERDDFVDRACNDAGLPMLRVKAALGYKQDELARQIAGMLPSSSKPTSEPRVARKSSSV